MLKSSLTLLRKTYVGYESKTDLLLWLESGELARAVAGLKFLAEKHGDNNLSLETGLQSGRLQNLLADRGRGIVGAADFLLEKNKIGYAIQETANKLPENWTAEGLESIPSGVVFSEKKKFDFGKLAMWLGILAAVAAIAGYSLRDFFNKKEPATIIAPIVAPAEKPAAEPVAEPAKPSEKPAGLPAISPGKPPKNQTNITIKDHGKAGTIITGDSNKIDIKQDF